jgi:N-methylhydantoinase B
MSMGAGFAVISGKDFRRDDAAYVNQLILGNNGGPASAQEDGWLTYALPDCAAAVYHDSIEILEAKYPLQVRSWRLIPDSGGPGRYRGAPSAEVIYGPRGHPMIAAYFIDGHHGPPQGVHGGWPGAAAFATKIEASGEETELDPVGLTVIEPGEWIRAVECGGGGYGDPLERETLRVRQDVLDRLVTPEEARDVYGVLVAVDDTLDVKIDSGGTEQQRRELRGRAREPRR